MQRLRAFSRLLALSLAIGVWLAANVSADPTPTPAKKKHHAAVKSADNDGDAQPSPSPAKRHHPRQQSQDAASEPEPTVTPAAGGDAGFHHASEDQTATGHASLPAATSSLDASDLRDFEAQPEPVRKLLSSALDLTRRNLTYTYGSADPAAGGMDCSGTMYYLLKSEGFDEAPRTASEQYAWVRKQSRFYAVLSKKADGFELHELRPGDLLFWTGTYNVDHDPPVTHAMLYLGLRKKDGKALMMGASDGRPYDGEKRNGVSVFDFKLPAARGADPADAGTAAVPDHAPDFAGYGPIPGMAERNDAASRQAKAAK